MAETPPQAEHPPETSVEVEEITTKVNEAIATGIVCTSSEAKEISGNLNLQLLMHPDSDDLKALNYRWQIYLNRSYVETHNIAEFLENLVQYVLKKKTDHPLEEMVLCLEESEGASHNPLPT